MKVINNEKEMINNFSIVRQEALSFFGNDDVYIEKFIDAPRHIEVQVIFGNTVHLGERECSIQRRHQKVIEEAPSPAIDEIARDKIGTIAIKEMGYLGLGTLEFLYHKGKFYFMEMNTRLQVEHPITEMITRIDLVREQKVANGEVLSIKQEDVVINGHSIECRINAEDPFNDFRPSPGKITTLHSPGGHGVRLDTHVYAGYSIPPNYDSMIAKLITTAQTREEAIHKMKRALDEFVIEGIKTTIPFHRQLMDHPEYIAGNYTTKFMEDFEMKPINKD